MRGPRPRGLLLLAALFVLPGCRSAGGPYVPEADAASEDGELRAGVASAELTPDRGYPLGGYGGGERRVTFPFLYGLGWPGRLSLAWHQYRGETGKPADLLAESRGTHDPLFAKALVLVPERGPPFAIVRLDLLECSAELHDRIAKDVESLGFRRETIFVAATHTHSGPASFLHAPLARLLAMDNFRPEIESRIVAAAAGAIKAAAAKARPAAIGFGSSRDDASAGRKRVAYNRRARRFEVGEIKEDDLDRDVQVMSVREAGTGGPIAVVLGYAVHPTVLSAANLYFSSDLVGPLEEGLRTRAGGGEALFLNGAVGDAGPDEHGGLAACRAEGEALATLGGLALEGVRTSPRARLHGAIGTRDLGSAWIYFAAGGRRRFHEADDPIGARLATAPLTLPANLVLWLVGFTNVRLAVGWNFTAGVVVDLDGYADRTAIRFGGLRIESGAEDVVLLGTPAEATHEVGLELRERAKKRGATRAWVAGLAFDAMGYAASEREYYRGGYEATSTLFGPTTAARVVESLDGVLTSLGYR